MKNINLFASLEVMKIAEELKRKDVVDWNYVMNAVRMLNAASKYEYVITDGGRPEGEGWEKTPHPKVPNSWRRVRKPGNNKPAPETTPESKPSRNFPKASYSQIPEDVRDSMENTMIMADNPDLEDIKNYMYNLSTGKSISSAVDDLMNTNYLDTSGADQIHAFGDDSYGKSAPARKYLSNLACQVMNTKPDGYCINETNELTPDELVQGEQFVRANQLAAYMAGLVDKDGYITAYRGTNNQYKDGKYNGTNCESWTVNPLKSFYGENQLLKAKIPVERVIGCFAGTGENLYVCDENEITVNTYGLDFQCEQIAEGENYVQKERIVKNEALTAAGNIRDNILNIMKTENPMNNEPETNKKPEPALNPVPQSLPESLEARALMAADEETSSEMLDKLALDDDWWVRANTAGNSNTSANTLDLLADDEQMVVRKTTAKNPHASEESLIKLAQDHYAAVRQNVANNKNSTKKVLQLLLNDKDEKVATAARKNYQEKGFGENQNITSSKKEGKMSDFNSKKLNNLAIRIGAETMYRYDPNHKNRPHEGGYWRETDKGWSRIQKPHSLGTDDLSRRLQNQLDEDSPDMDELDSIYNNPGATDKMKKDIDSFKEKRKKLDLAQSDTISDDDAEWLMGDEDDDVRESLAQNQYTPLSVLQELMNDRSRFVRDFAQETYDGVMESRVD